MKLFKFMFALISVIIVVSLFGCSASPSSSIKYEALEVGGYDSLDGGAHQSEFPLWDSALRNYHQDDSAPKSASVTFNGENYYGEYNRSIVWIPTLHKTHVYTGDGFRFDINGSTGELISLQIYDSEARTLQNDQTACRSIADEIVSNYINVEDFEVTCDAGDDYYAFSYDKKINGIKTTDSVSITVNRDGNVTHFGYTTLHAFDDVDASDIDATRAEETALSKIESIYSGNTQRINSEIKSVVLIKMEDGTIAFYYTVKNEFRDADKQYGSLVNLLVKVK